MPYDLEHFNVASIPAKVPEASRHFGRCACTVTAVRVFPDKKQRSSPTMAIVAKSNTEETGFAGEQLALKLRSRLLNACAKQSAARAAA
jgi:hypothetical protein